METAFLVILNFCVQVMGPPRCGHIEDQLGPYQTQQECKERIHEMFNYMGANFPPNSVIAEMVDNAQDRCPRCGRTGKIEVHGHYQCAACGSVIDDCCQGECAI